MTSGVIVQDRQMPSSALIDVPGWPGGREHSTQNQLSAPNFQGLRNQVTVEAVCDQKTWWEYIRNQIFMAAGNQTPGKGFQSRAHPLQTLAGELASI